MSIFLIIAALVCGPVRAEPPKQSDLDQKAIQLADEIVAVVANPSAYRSEPPTVWKEQARQTLSDIKARIKAKIPEKLEPVKISQIETSISIDAIGNFAVIPFIFVPLLVAANLEHTGFYLAHHYLFDKAFFLHMFLSPIYVLSTYGALRAAEHSKKATAILGSMLTFPRNTWIALHNLARRRSAKERRMQSDFKQKLRVELESRGLRVDTTGTGDCEVTLDDKPVVRIANFDELEFLDDETPIENAQKKSQRAQ